MRDVLPHADCERLFAGESPIRVWREFLSMSIAELAGEARLHPNTVERAENGTRKLNARELRQIASALGVERRLLDSPHKAYDCCCVLPSEDEEEALLAGID